MQLVEPEPIKAEATVAPRDRSLAMPLLTGRSKWTSHSKLSVVVFFNGGEINPGHATVSDHVTSPIHSFWWLGVTARHSVTCQHSGTLSWNVAPVWP